MYLEQFWATFSKPLEAGKLPNVPSEILLKLASAKFSHVFNPSSLTCSQPGARTQAIVFMIVHVFNFGLKTMYLEQFWTTFQNPSTISF